MSPEESAKQVLMLNWDKTLPVDPVTICNNMGVGLFFDPALIMSGQFTHASGKPVIYINPNESIERQRFTAFHELGHYVLGHGDSDRVPYRIGTPKSFDPKESEANRFAAEMIMPQEVVFFYVQQQGYTLSQLSSLLAVSEMAMSIRLQRLGIVSRV